MVNLCRSAQFFVVFLCGSGSVLGLQIHKVVE